MGEYLTVNGLKTYYEVQGDGDPLMLLHGGGVGADSWVAQTPVLAERYTVYVPERRGHARTPDLEGPITTKLMADDTAALLDALGTGPAHLVGWSDGAKVALRVALQRPDLVRKLVLIGANVRQDGATRASLAMTHGGGSAELVEMMRPQYEAHSPDGPEHFPVFFEKLRRMWQEEPGVRQEELATLRMPALVMQGDDDGVRIEHSVAIASALADGQLAIVPGASHALPLEKPTLVNQLLMGFLGGERSFKYMPLGALEE